MIQRKESLDVSEIVSAIVKAALNQTAMYAMSDIIDAIQTVVEKFSHIKNV